MKRYVSLIVMCFCLITVYGQNNVDDPGQLREEADHYYDLEQYNLSIVNYRKLVNAEEINPALTYRLAECYRKTFNYKEAEPYYFKVLHLAPLEFPLSGYYYGLMLKLNGKYDESITYFDDFITKNQNNNSVVNFVDQAMIDRAGSEAALSDSFSKDDRYSLLLQAFNSAFNDYAPALADTSRLIITSGRISSSITSVDERYGEAFTDNYYYENLNGKWQDHTRQIRNLNSRSNDGSGSFNRKGDKYYFTVCDRGTKCRIVVSQIRSGRWTDPKKLNDNINIENFESKHPAVSPGGDTLLFATDRSGGFGGFDIWMSIDAGNDDWGPAKNLGSYVNTKMNEVAPSFSEFNHVFFFASEGHQGMGGMDLYMGKRFSDGKRSVYNLGYPFNSNHDDCFISFSKHELYLSSNRDGGVGGFDIYSAAIKSPLSFISRLSLKHQAGRGDIVLASLRSEASMMDLFSSRREDRFEYENLTYEKKLIVDKMVGNRMDRKSNDPQSFPGISKDEYNKLFAIAQSQYRKMELQKRYKKTFLTKISTQNGSIAVNGVLIDSVTQQPIGSMNIFLMNENGEVLKATSTNESGIFRFTNVSGGENLYLRFEGHHAANVRPGVTDLIVVEDTPDTFTFDNIYFDTDHYDLSPDAKEVLKRLGDFLKLIPDSQVEIFAYADDRGTDAYNFQLTKKRGEEVRKYLGSIGVDETSVAVVAKGRQTLEDFNNEEKRQFNRRVEFYINGEKSSSLVTADGNK